jgi:hypothetical protein
MGQNSMKQFCKKPTYPNAAIEIAHFAIEARAANQSNPLFCCQV